ncbi:MAG: hypothetical protein GX442_08965, partial [Candidatus Riflebacteria bacterium]|nr:hypothetical protein [Candidatus Riflebacteria bacterium]
LAAVASDADGSVLRVDFFAGTTLLGSANPSSASVGVSSLTAGTHLLAAHAFDDRLAEGMSPAVPVSVVPASAPPGIVLLFIGDGMGPEQVKAARWFSRGVDGRLAMEAGAVVGQIAEGGIRASTTKAVGKYSGDIVRLPWRCGWSLTSPEDLVIPSLGSAPCGISLRASCRVIFSYSFPIYDPAALAKWVARRGVPGTCSDPQEFGNVSPKHGRWETRALTRSCPRNT